VFNDPMEAHTIGFNMWVKAVEKAGTTDRDAVIDAMVGIAHPNLSGDYATMMPNHHLTKPVLIGEVQGNGQFNVVWQTPGLIVAQPWSPYLPEKWSCCSTTSAARAITGTSAKSKPPIALRARSG
jgi:urea transport system substrate-binding protein